jgi:hypothetical protein
MDTEPAPAPTHDENDRICLTAAISTLVDAGWSVSFSLDPVHGIRCALTDAMNEHTEFGFGPTPDEALDNAL